MNSLKPAPTRTLSPGLPGAVKQHPAPQTGQISRWVLLLLMLQAALTVLPAQELRDRVLQVKFFYESIDFEQAIQSGSQLLKSSENFSADELDILHRYLGLSYYNVGKIDSARSHFLSLLSVHPQAALDPVSISPKIIDFFEQLKRDLEATAQPPAAPFRRYVFVEDRRPAAGWRSALFPGWGQFYKQQKTRGYVLGGLFWAGLISTGIAALKESNAHQTYLDSGTAAEAAANYGSYNNWYKTRRTLSAATVVLWAVAVGDALWTPYHTAALAVQPDGGVTLSVKVDF